MLIAESIARPGDGNLKLERVNEAIHGITTVDTRIKALVDEIRSSPGAGHGHRGYFSQLVRDRTDDAELRSISEESAAASEELVAQALDQLAVDLRELVS